MSDSEVKVVISGEAQGVIATMQAAASAVRTGVSEMKESLAGVSEGFAGLIEGFGAFAGILAGGAAFKEVIGETKQWEGECIQLARTLGTTTTAASTFMVAIEDVGGGADDFAAASRGLTRQLKTNEDGLNAMGIATRDANGNLLDGTTLLFNAIEAVNEYTAGTDRNLAAQTAFGRGVTANSAVLKLTRESMEEAEATAKDLNLVVGPENVAALRENKVAMAGAMDVFKGVAKTIGDALLPVLTELAQWFREVGPVAIGITKGLIGGLVTSFYELQFAAKVVGSVVGAVFATIGDVLEQLFQSAGLAIQGKFGAAGDALKAIGSKVHQDWAVSFDQIADDAKSTAAKVKQLFSEQSEGVAPKQGKSFDLQPKDTPGPDNRLALFKNALEQMNQARGDFDAKDIQADLAYWEAILANTVGNSKEDVKLRAEISKEILALNKKQHDEDLKGAEEYEKTVESLQLGEIDARKEALSQALALDKITQTQEIAGEIELANEKYAIQKKALDDKLALLQFDQLAQQKVKDQELLLEQKHAADVQKLVDKSAQEQNKAWSDLFKSMQSGFASTISGFLKGTTSLGATIKGLFTDIGSAIVDSIAKMAAQFLTTSLMQLLTSKTTGASIIAGLAAQAAAGAFASTAAIPVVGPELAPAAAATAYSETIAWQAAASAAGGFDIPAGMNPVTQLHSQEMVLPASLANKVRSGQGIGGGGGTVVIQALDAQSFAKWARQNSSTFGAAMQGVHSRFGLS